MSQSTSGQSLNPAHTSSQALLDELRLAADRAREERLKLARLFKHTADLPVNPAPAPSEGAITFNGDSVPELISKVERLEALVAEKFETLDEVQQSIESRTQYLESLRHTITETTSAFVLQVEQAQHFKAHIDAAKHHVRMSAGKVAEDVRRHLRECEKPVAERFEQLTELDRQIDQRIARMQQMHKQAGEAVDKHLLGALRAAKEQAADLAAPVKAEIDKHLQAQRDAIEKAIHRKIAELDVDVEEALSPLTERFSAIVNEAEERADELAQSLPARLEAEAESQLDVIRTAFAAQAEAIVMGTDAEAMSKAEAVIRERIAQSLDGYLEDAEQQAGGYVDGLIARLDEAQAQALERFEQALVEIESNHTLEHDKTLEEFKAALREIAADHAIDHEDAIGKLDAEVHRLHQQAQLRLDSAKVVLEDAVDGIHAMAGAAVDSAIASSKDKLEAYEATTKNQLRAIDDGIEEGIEQSRKRLGEFEKDARRIEDDAVAVAEAALAAAQQRVAGFEDLITRRVGLAAKACDDAIGSVDRRLDKVEQDAAARVAHIVDLAESSGKAVADSIDALAQSAEQTAAKAQQDLDAKLQAFEQISAEALKQAEQTLRQNIGELRDASRAMIEVVVKQVKSQTNEIEPQTREIIQQAEQTLRRRIGELRDGAQSMVDLTVSRLEGQLDEVKRKAQQAAFFGLGPDQGEEPSTSDAA